MDQKGIEILDKFENPDTDSDYQKVRIDVILLNKFLTSHTGDQVSVQKFQIDQNLNFAIEFKISVQFQNSIFSQILMFWNFGMKIMNSG